MSTNHDRIDDADREERIQELKEQARQAAG
jgi:hypothetical protein